MAYNFCVCDRDQAFLLPTGCGRGAPAWTPSDGKLRRWADQVCVAVMRVGMVCCGRASVTASPALTHGRGMAWTSQPIRWRASSRCRH
jgi:hypothetical protein